LRLDNSAHRAISANNAWSSPRGLVNLVENRPDPTSVALPHNFCLWREGVQSRKGGLDDPEPTVEVEDRLLGLAGLHDYSLRDSVAHVQLDDRVLRDQGVGVLLERL